MTYDRRHTELVLREEYDVSQRPAGERADGLMLPAPPRTWHWRYPLIVAAVVILAAAYPAAHRLSAWQAPVRSLAPRAQVVAAPPRKITEIEKQALLRLTEATGPSMGLQGKDALTRNEALPFAKTAIEPARPFAGVHTLTASGQTALTCLTQAVYYEAGFEPAAGKRAVAQVVLNRLRHPAFPKSVCGVVYQGSLDRVCQFSFTCDGSLLRKPQHEAWLAAETVARGALAGAVESSIGQATHYHASYVFPYWAPRLTKLVKIGAHIFYRWPGSWGMAAAFTGAYDGLEYVPAARSLSPDEQMAQALDGQAQALGESGFVPGRLPVQFGRPGLAGRMEGARKFTPIELDPYVDQEASTAVALRQSGGRRYLDEAAGGGGNLR